MSQSPAPKKLSEKLQESELQYDINRMTVERDYHMTQGFIFDDAIKNKKQELKKIHEPENFHDGEMYK
ncbi:MAG: hypothetical protein HOD60_04800 [Candidatus Nitrosopelagicus sp.]|jgi:hypothetical protein|nr:hypothetical protein [Candidatus Nitrosopelagicus sp.]